MAKKKLEDISSKKSLFDSLKDLDDSIEIIADSVYSNINDWIPTGNYILNAACSGSIFKGVPAGRCSTLYGPSSCLPANEKIEIYILKNISQKHEVQKHI